MKRLGISVLLVVFTLIVIISPASAAIGTGVLNVINADDVKDGTYYVTPCNDYTIRIDGITEYNPGDTITIKISWKDTGGVSQTDILTDIVEGSIGNAYVEFSWHVPIDAQICTTGTVHYTMKPGDPDYLAVGFIGSEKPGHLHYVPENPLGVIGSILAIFAGLGIFILTKSKSSNRLVLRHL